MIKILMEHSIIGIVDL